MPPPKHYVDQKFSPVHLHIFFLFEQLKEKHPTIGLDNLYISAKFIRQAFAGKKAVMVHGTACKSGCRLLKFVIQEKIKKMQGGRKAMKNNESSPLQRDPDCPNLVAFSVYGTKPVHFLTTAATSLMWIERQK
jgi:hypothetical protein